MSARIRSCAERIARQLARFGVPVSMQTELVGTHYSEIVTQDQIAKQTALWKLALVYNAIAEDKRGHFTELDDAFNQAQSLGVAYMPQGLVVQRIQDRAAWVKGSRVIKARNRDTLDETKAISAELRRLHGPEAT